MVNEHILIISTIVLVYGLTVLPVLVLSQEKKIVAELLANYGSRYVRPLHNSSQSIDITLRVLIAQIVEFDEPRQQLTVNAWRKMSWRDEYLVWNPDDFNGENEISVSESDIWTPQLMLVEDVHYEFLSMKDVELTVSSDGSVVWFTPIMFQISCNVNVGRFPFDEQYCKVSFMHWVYDMRRFNLCYFDDEDANQVIFSNNGVWNLIKVNTTRVEIRYACCEAPFPRIVLSLTLQRASKFYIFSMLIPSILLTTITLLIFCMPPESGEKISLGMTNLLAFILFQQLIADHMPPQGTEIPIVTTYLFCMVIVGCASIFVSVFVLRLFHTSVDKPIPETVVWLIARNSLRKEAISWKAVAKVVDRFMLIVFLLVSVVILTVSIIRLFA